MNPTKEEIAKIRAAAEKATKGPWKSNPTVTGWIQAENGNLVASAEYSSGHSAAKLISAKQCKANADFIALTDPTTMIAMCDALEAKDGPGQWSLKEWPHQTHLRAKTAEELLAKVKCLFGEQLFFAQLQAKDKEIEQAIKFLEEALPQMACVTHFQNGLITAIGTFLEALNKKGE